ncbi:SpaH/EbpB family LPXTG-anchored major pilin [Corynebacterium callunae]|uniref:SpaH/EbpB family LPXTG-anchored major pilin n=1 Tax=Corynebacterium callunae TaxID=1721 RepID=UPI003982B9DD
MKKNHKRISAAVLSLALGFTVAGAPIVAPVAGAQVAISAGDASTVDLDADVSLTINKFAGEPGATTGNTPLQSIFTVKKITLTNQLNTLAGWQEVATKQAALPTTLPAVSTDIDDAWTLTTINGTATISTAIDADFTVGAYLVTETAPSGYTVSAPFIVTVPFTNQSGNNWDYDQTVQPKNQTVSVEKNVTDSGVRLGTDLSYTISASIPAEDLTSLVIEDPLPAELSAAKNIVVTTTSTGGANDRTLSEDLGTGLGGDYTVTHTGNDLKVTLTGQGLNDLNTLRNGDSGLTLNVSFDATVIALPGDGVISNDAIVRYPNSTINTATSPTDPYPGTETRLSSLTVTKQDSAATPAAITGTDGQASATFELWRCSLVSGKWTVTGSALPVITDPAIDTAGELPTTPVTSFSTNFSTGIATIYGVQTFNFENGAATAGTSTTCLVETKAPAGYNLNPEPIPVNTYSNATTPSAANYAMVANIKNIKNDDIVNLPETGGNGTMSLIAAGVVVAAAGGAVAVRGNRARKTN